jgi:hypothetical protein
MCLSVEQQVLEAFRKEADGKSLRMYVCTRHSSSF